MAAKAELVAWICCTPLSWSWTAELSPPLFASPQVTTDPSSRIAAKAPYEAWIRSTPLSWSRTSELSPPESASPQVTTDPSARIAAKAPRVAWICCTPLSWSRTAELSPPERASPQVTTHPSSRIAAKAPGVAWICCTPWSLSRTAELSPPERASPQVTTDPSSRIAAKAPGVAWICCAPRSWSRTAELLPPYSARPQVTIALCPWHHKTKALCVAASCGWSTRAVRHSPSSISASSKVVSGSTKTRFLAVTSLRYLFPKARSAFVLTSWTVDEDRSVRSSACPFGKATFIWFIWAVLKILRTFQHISKESLLHTLSPTDFSWFFTLSQSIGSQMLLAVGDTRTMAEWKTKVDKFRPWLPTIWVILSESGWNQQQQFTCLEQAFGTPGCRRLSDAVKSRKPCQRGGMVATSRFVGEIKHQRSDWPLL